MDLRNLNNKADAKFLMSRSFVVKSMFVFHHPVTGAIKVFKGPLTSCPQQETNEPRRCQQVIHDRRHSERAFFVSLRDED